MRNDNGDLLFRTVDRDILIADSGKIDDIFGGCLQMDRLFFLKPLDIKKHIGDIHRGFDILLIDDQLFELTVFRRDHFGDFAVFIAHDILFALMFFGEKAESEKIENREM